jgi:hypothetical protein
MKKEHFEQESQFNMGLAYLKRIDRIFYVSWNCSQIQDVNGWISALRVLQRELCVKMSETEYNNLDKDFNEITKDMKNGISPQVKNKVSLKLHQLEVKLRRTAQEKGMLLPSKKDISQAALDM